MQAKEKFSAIYFRKFWSLISLNVVVVLFSLPVVTMGPAITAGLTITRRYVNNEVSIFWRDFLTAFKDNFKQSFFYWLISTVLMALLVIAALFYFAQGVNFAAAYIASAICGLLLILLFAVNGFAYYMIISVDLKLMEIIKNAVALSISKPGSGGLMVICFILSLVAIYFLFPLSLLLVVLFIVAFMLLVCAYAVEPVIMDVFKANA